jgi:hypothetical protein
LPWQAAEKLKIERGEGEKEDAAAGAKGSWGSFVNQRCARSVSFFFYCVHRRKASGAKAIRRKLRCVTGVTQVFCQSVHSPREEINQMLIECCFGFLLMQAASHDIWKLHLVFVAISAT